MIVDIAEHLRFLASGRPDISQVLIQAAEKIDGQQAAIERFQHEIQKLNNAITWDTSCLNCSSLLDASYAETVRAEKAEAELERVKPVLEAAKAWRAWFPHHDSMFAPENALITAVDAWKNTAPTAPSQGACPDCGSSLDGAHGPNCVVTRLAAAFGPLTESPEQAQAAFERLMARLKAEGSVKAVDAND